MATRPKSVPHWCFGWMLATRLWQTKAAAIAKLAASRRD